jgi:hypothetical protein
VGQDFCTHPDRPWGPPSILYKGYRVSFQGVKRPGPCINHPPPPSAKVKERTQLYTYSPSGPSWRPTGRNVPLPVTHLNIVLSLRMSGDVSLFSLYAFLMCTGAIFTLYYSQHRIPHKSLQQLLDVMCANTGRQIQQF